MELRELFLDLEWKDEAQCQGTTQDIFFPNSYEGSPRWAEMVSIAKSICRSCVVKGDCLDYALSTKQDEGIWGGMTVAERKRVRKRVG